MKTKTTVNTKRLLKLASFLQELPPSHFDFNRTIKKVAKSKEVSCGTIGCAIGWCPTVFPRVIKVKLRRDWALFSMKGEDFDTMEWSGMGAKLFGIPFSHSQALFTPNTDSPANDGRLREDATPKQMATRIRKYVRWAIKTKVQGDSE